MPLLCFLHSLTAYSLAWGLYLWGFKGGAVSMRSRAPITPRTPQRQRHMDALLLGH